jgi:DNA-binding transcriptional regulator YiaG
MTKKELVQAISQMPYYQAMFTQKTIANMLDNDEIPEETIEQAKENIVKFEQKSAGLDIQDLRKKLKMNTKQFGEACGVSPRTVEDWEQGRRNPSGAALKLLEMLREKI